MAWPERSRPKPCARWTPRRRSRSTPRRRVLYYPRPNLIEFIAGRLPYARLFAFPERWYADRKIDVRLGTPVERIFASSREIEIGGGRRVSYDALLLANGASSFVPPIGRREERRLHPENTGRRPGDPRIRGIDHPRAAVIGGGLLGLEIARALRIRGADVDSRRILSLSPAPPA